MFHEYLLYTVSVSVTLTLQCCSDSVQEIWIVWKCERRLILFVRSYKQLRKFCFFCFCPEAIWNWNSERVFGANFIFNNSDWDSEGDFIPVTCNFFMKLQFLSPVNVAFQCIMFVHHYVVHSPRTSNNTTSNANSVFFLIWSPPSPLSPSVTFLMCTHAYVCVCWAMNMII